jgi:putative ATPase
MSSICIECFYKTDLESLLQRALTVDSYLRNKSIELRETEALLRLSGGDGRKLLYLNLL